MRKVLSFVLVLALVLGSFSMAFADNHMFSDMAGESSSEAVTVLKDLGVVAGYPDGTFRPDQIVTRAEMARFIVAALGLEQFAVGTTSKYPDMVQAPWAQGYVAYGTSLGFISGYPDGTFKPNQQVSFQEAASMLVRALGYTEAFLPGGWPTEWMVKANSLGIFDDVTMASGAAGADRGAIALMLYNALDLSIGQVNNDNDWVAFNVGTALVFKADTMLHRLGAKDYNDGNAFLVTKTEADAAVANIMPFIGAWVKAYANKDGDIIAIKSVESTFLTGKMSGTKFRAGGVDYNISTTIRTATTAAFENVAKEATDPVLDDWLYAGSTAQDVTLAVKWSGVTIQEVYSVQKWVVSEHGFFSDSDADDIAKDDMLFGFDFPLDSSNNIKTKAFDLVGASSINDIPEDAVVYVYAYGDDANGDIVKVAVGTKEVTGEISRISGNDYTINGTVYQKVAIIGHDNGDSVSAGDDVIAYLDFNGKVYEFELVDGGVDNYAILLSAQSDDGGGFFGTTAKMRLFLADGTAKVFDVNKDDFAYGSTTAGSIFEDLDPGTMFLYGLDKDGKIDVLEDVSNTSASITASISATGFFRETLASNAIKVASDVLVYTYDSGAMTNPDNYDVVTLATLLDTKDITVYSYDVDGGQIVALYIKADVVSETGKYGVVVGSATNNSDAGKEVSLLVDGVKVTYNTSDLSGTTLYSKTTDTLLYKLSFNSAGDVSLGASGGTTVAAVVTTAGAFTASGSKVEVTTTSGISGMAVGTYWLSDSAVVYTYSTVDNVYKVGAVRDIQTKEGVTITFYDVLDGSKVGTDGVYDYVLIK